MKSNLLTLIVWVAVLLAGETVFASKYHGGSYDGHDLAASDEYYHLDGALIFAFSKYAGGSYDGYAMGTSVSDISLPVTLMAFAATAGDGQVSLHWVTESEIENLGFIVERRITTGHPEPVEGWAEIASYITHQELQGQGSVTYRTEYSYTDNTVEVGFTYDYRLADVSYEGVKEYHSMNVLGVSVTENIPDDFTLYPAYPNPFNPSTTIQFDLPARLSDGQEAVQVKLTVYDLQGREVKTLVNGLHEAGSYSVKWSGKNDNGVKLSSGIYFVVMKANAMTTSQKIVLLR